MLNRIVRGETKFSPATGEKLGRSAEQPPYGMPVVLADCRDVGLEWLVVDRNPRLFIGWQEAGGVARDLAVKERGALGANSHDSNVAGHACTTSFLRRAP